MHRLLMCCLLWLWSCGTLAQQAAPENPATPPAAPAATPSAPASAPPPAETLLPPFAMADGALLRIVLPRGQLVVRPATDGQVRVQGAILPGQRLRQSGTPARTVLRLDDPDRPRPAEANVSLAVPPGVALALTLDDTSLDLEDVAAPALVVLGGRRPIRIRSTAARARVSSLSGPLDLVLAGQDIGVDSLSGGIRLLADGDAPRLRVRSLSGDIAINAPRPGVLRVESVGGDVQLVPGQGREPVAVETVSGDIDLRLPEPVSVVLRFAPGRQPVALGAGMTVNAEGEVSLGGGGWPVRLATVGGRFRIGSAAAAESPPAAN